MRRLQVRARVPGPSAKPKPEASKKAQEEFQARMQSVRDESAPGRPEQCPQRRGEIAQRYANCLWLPPDGQCSSHR